MKDGGYSASASYKGVKVEGKYTLDDDDLVDDLALTCDS